MEITYHTTPAEIYALVHPCRCKACELPCRFGSGALVDDDLERLSQYLELSKEEVKKKYLEEITKFGTTLLKPKLKKEKNKPYGKCIFFDEKKGCLVHLAKPTECRIAMGCKDYGEDLIVWFNLRHYLDPKNPESIRQYKLYLDSGGKSLKGAELESIADERIIKKAFDYHDLKLNKDWEKLLGLKQ